jgi:hypothetical protein
MHQDTSGHRVIQLELPNLRVFIWQSCVHESPDVHCKVQTKNTYEEGGIHSYTGLVLPRMTQRE